MTVGRERRSTLEGLQRLWSPWRMAYIADPGRTTSGCPFCVLPEQGDDRASHVVHRGETAYVILNAYPYNPGHLMIVPYRHTDDLCDLDDEELVELTYLCRSAVEALREASAPSAFNIGFNLGDAAGAGIAEHLHQHVVPRWSGDTNFVTVVGDTRVLPQLLEETYDRLAPLFTRGAE